ncbi:OLC1v1034816C1 [Oldenlandia corymbosa var. corymbosa]|uniref:OLC1v1034816C1 n=1 Tax=Oldenlandia corymbosa var. corymbosa TaxID=529605 RepID=A0AAV1CUD6_OLDCO|nr:OLC1v1034816C1 [Oldenlandia corymbosa var. corymbosa]
MTLPFPYHDELMMTDNINTTTTGSLPISNPKQSSLASTPSSSGHSSDMSPLSAILSLLVLIAIPALIYAFFFAINCPPIQLRRPRRRQSQADSDHLSSSCKESKETELVTAGGIKYTKEADHEEEYGGECPVCLSAFVEGDFVRQLSGCKHSFHVGCIDRWLVTHSNCPVCRASVPSLAPTGRLKRPATTQRAREDDFTQGLPDAASLV